jgi:DNA processing protein
MKEVWESDMQVFREKKFDERIINAVLEVKKNKNPDAELEKISKLKINAVTIKDENYPKLLKEISDPPALIYIKGEFKPEDEISLAIVGARKFTPYARLVVEKIVGPLALEHIVIVSGLALGVDAIAHKETLNQKGRTIAVLGNGLDKIYPETNSRLADEILTNDGALISEFPVGTPSFKQNFPFRNRIIAGLTLGTLVVEAALQSGSLITAKAALDYNREVFAVPGSIFNDNSLGPNNLIKMGAKPVICYEDVLTELNIEKKSEHNKARKIIPDSKEEAILLDILSSNPMYIDNLVESSKLDIVKINQTLVLMEMKGRVKNLGGNQYILQK